MQLAPVSLTALSFNNELQHAFPRLKSHSNFGYSSNIVEKSNVPVKETVSYPVEYRDEFNSSSSVKYPELYPPPNHSKYVELQLGQYDPDHFLMFPLETSNTIPTPATDFKQQQDLSTLQLDSESSISAEPNCWLTGRDDFDIDSLFVFPTPSNKEKASIFTGDPSWELLAGLKQPIPILEDMDFINHLEANLPDEIHYWNGFQKDSSYQESDTIQEPKVDPDSFVSNSTMEQHLQAQQHTLVLSRTVSYDTSASPETPYSGQPAEVSPVAVASLTSDEMQIETPLSAGESWGQNLQTLTLVPEAITTFDHTPCDQLPPLNVLFENSSPLNSLTNEQTEVEMKPKTTLLFGKHESEIIHKLLPATPTKPLTRDKLIVMPVEDFNTRLEQAQLSEIEVAFMKEWRRRGKNKAAAQTARKRKREEVSSLDQEVYNMRQQRTELEKRCDELKSLVASLTARSKVAEDKLYERQSTNTGQPVSQNTHHIHITEDNELLLIPRANTKITVAN